jgi:hypothetical protein
MKHMAAKAIGLGILMGASAAASAFTPAGGLWGFTNELNGQPGRGFQLTVENDTLIFYYYGYDSDGSGNYMFASGPLVNGSVFTGQLLSCRGGTVMGSAYKAATCSNGPGKVTMAFSSGEKGTITLPGESPKPINRFNFGYADGPDALLGEFLFAYKADTFNNIDIYRLTTKTGRKTQQRQGTGTGMVVDAQNTMGCEYYVIANEFHNIYMCTELRNDEDDDIYIFRMVGDRGVGRATWYGHTGSHVFPAQVIRTETAKGTRTGPYAETDGMVTSPKAATGNFEVPADDAMVDALVEAKRRESLIGPQTGHAAFDEGEWQMAKEWAAQARTILRDLQNKRK